MSRMGGCFRPLAIAALELELTSADQLIPHSLANSGSSSGQHRTSPLKSGLLPYVRAIYSCIQTTSYVYRSA